VRAGEAHIGADVEKRQQAAGLQDEAEMPAAQPGQGVAVAGLPEPAEIDIAVGRAQAEGLGRVGADREADELEEGALAAAARADQRQEVARPEAEGLDLEGEGAVPRLPALDQTPDLQRDHAALPAGLRARG